MLILTFQAAALLRKLRKAQITERDTVFVDFDELTAATVRAVDKPPVGEVSLERFATSLRSVLAYLVAEEYIIQGEVFSSRIQLTHKGWHRFQITFRVVMLFILKNVFLPLVIAAAVSVITTLITLVLKGYVK